MAVMVQVRNVPESLYRKLKARAAMAGVSLSDYVLAELRRSLDRPTREQLLERLAKRSPVVPRPLPAEILRAERDMR